MTDTNGNQACCSIGDRIIAPCTHSPTGLLKDHRDPAMRARADSADGGAIRLDAADDPIATARRAAEERFATMHCHTDGERSTALERLEKERQAAKWMTDFRDQRFRADSSDEEMKRLRQRTDEARQAAAERISNAWRVPADAVVKSDSRDDGDDWKKRAQDRINNQWKQRSSN